MTLPTVIPSLFLRFARRRTIIDDAITLAFGVRMHQHSPPAGVAIESARGISQPSDENTTTTYLKPSSAELLYTTGRTGWRKKCFQLPLRCFTLPLRDAMAVVDPARRIHGIVGLHVADAAIMPTVVSGTTNAATIMIGERVADLVREKLRLAA